MATLHSHDEVAERLAIAQGGEADSDKQPKRWATTSMVVENLIGFIRNPAERWYLGFPEIDLATRGVAKGSVIGCRSFPHREVTDHA